MDSNITSNGSRYKSLVRHTYYKSFKRFRVWHIILMSLEIQLRIPIILDSKSSIIYFCGSLDWEHEITWMIYIYIYIYI